MIINLPCESCPHFLKSLSKLLNCLNIKWHYAFPSGFSLNIHMLQVYPYSHNQNSDNAVFKMRSASFFQFIDLSIQRISVGIPFIISNTQTNGSMMERFWHSSYAFQINHDLIKHMYSTILLILLKSMIKHTLISVKPDFCQGIHHMNPKSCLFSHNTVKEWGKWKFVKDNWLVEGKWK